ncbi:MAG: hypothetical protein HKN87_13660 [Saprospiraceae bacterium]|nr:hypothetical protein [Saprospiraceae bacterium]
MKELGILTLMTFLLIGQSITAMAQNKAGNTADGWIRIESVPKFSATTGYAEKLRKSPNQFSFGVVREMKLISAKGYRIEKSKMGFLIWPTAQLKIGDIAGEFKNSRRKLLSQNVWPIYPKA